MIIHECDSDYNGEPFIPEGDCFATPLKTKHCRNAGLIWSRGSDEVNICFKLKLFTRVKHLLKQKKIQYYPNDTGSKNIR